MADHDTMLRPGDPRWAQLEAEPSPRMSSAEALRRGIELSRVAAQLKAAGSQAARAQSDDERAQS